MARHRTAGSGGALVSKPVLLFNSALDSTPDLSRPRPHVPSTPPSLPSSVASTPDPPSCASFGALAADDCEELLDHDPDYEALKAEAYLGALGALQGSSRSSRSSRRGSSSGASGSGGVFGALDRFDRAFERAPRTPSSADSVARRLSTASTASKLSKRRTLRLSKSSPALAPPPVISHPMPLGAARRIRKVPSIQEPPSKGRLGALPRMFAWRL